MVEITEEDTGSTEDEPVAEKVSTDDGSDEGDVEADVSDLEIGDDYDEARTQYELAKVFVDLGDEDGARKILGDIVANANNSEDVLEDASKLLESIDS